MCVIARNPDLSGTKSLALQFQAFTTSRPEPEKTELDLSMMSSPEKKLKSVCEGSGLRGKKIILLLCTLLFLPSVISAATADKEVERLRKYFSGVTDISGSFSQTSYIKDIEETQKFSGIFFIKKPSSLMWEYDSPRDEKVIIRDTVTWIYRKNDNQVLKSQFNKKALSRVPLALLTSIDTISNDYDISMTEENALQLNPKKPMGFIRTMIFELAPSGFPIKMFTVIDTYGNIIMIELSDIKTNPGLEDSLFEFTPPPGTEVFDLNE